MKCAVSDFDRTLYVDGSISGRNLQALRAWQKDGNWFVLATGRNESSIRAMLDRYGVKPDALILNNGARILDREWRELFCRTIDKTVALEVLAYLHEIDDDGSGVSMRRGKVNVLSRTGTTTQKTCDGVITMEEAGCLDEVVQIHRRKFGEEEKIEALCRDLNARFSGISAYANVCNADIVACGVDKAAAIDWLARHEGGFDEIRVIGDSANDVCMIRRYQGATLRSASLAVQAVAEIVVGDVAEVLEGRTRTEG